MDFRPSTNREILSDRIDEEGSTSLLHRHDDRHDFDAPAWRGLGGRTHSSAVCRRFPPRLIDLERRARFASLPLDRR